MKFLESLHMSPPKKNLLVASFTLKHWEYTKTIIFNELEVDLVQLFLISYFFSTFQFTWILANCNEVYQRSCKTGWDDSSLSWLFEKTCMAAWKTLGVLFHTFVILNLWTISYMFSISRCWNRQPISNYCHATVRRLIIYTK